MKRLAPAFLIVLLAGCAAQAPQAISLVKPEPFPVQTSSTPVSENGSIFPTDTSGSLYENQRTWEPGDLVTINIITNTTATNNENASMSRASTINASASALLGVAPNFGSLAGQAFSPTFNTSNKQAFTGTGADVASDTVSGEITAVVVGVEPNGVLALSGRENVNINGSVRSLVVTGFARPSEIGPNNTINSNQLANINVQYVGNGATVEAGHEPWLQNAISRYLPF